MAVPQVKFPLFLCVRVLGVIVAALVLIWNISYRGGLALISDDKSLIFNVIFLIEMSYCLSGKKNLLILSFLCLQRI